MELKDFSVHGADKYWTVEDKQYDGRVVSMSRKFWTLTVHDPNCRYAKKKAPGMPPFQSYFGSDGLINLASRGLKPPAGPYNGVVWQGCKVCGTASQPNENWKARGQAVIDAEKAVAARRREREQAESVIQDAKDDYERAQRNAAIAWQEAHKAELEGVRMAAAAEWVAANPERAKLLDARAPSWG